MILTSWTTPRALLSIAVTVAGLAMAVPAPARAQATAPPTAKEKEAAKAKEAAKEREAAKEKARAQDSSKSNTTPARTIDLNNATAEEMVEALPGVGEATAAKIIAGRPYTALAGLEKAGVPPRTIEGLRGLVRFGTPNPPGPSSKAAPKGAPRISEKSKPATKDPEKSNPPRTPVNLNTATRAQLETLPFIGPVKADAIIKARPFKAKEDIMKVLGIKQGVFDRIKDSIRVD